MATKAPAGLQPIETDSIQIDLLLNKLASGGGGKPPVLLTAFVCLLSRLLAFPSPSFNF